MPTSPQYSQPVFESTEIAVESKSILSPFRAVELTDEVGVHLALAGQRQPIQLPGQEIVHLPQVAVREGPEKRLIATISTPSGNRILA